MGNLMNADQITIRPFAQADAFEVRTLFITVNRLLAPPELKQAFETYIAQSLKDEIDRISGYYEEKGGHFWIAQTEGKVVGMFGLEPSGPNSMELRRMYVDPGYRRLGIAKRMLSFAEDHCRSKNLHKLDLSTSEIQSDALSFYRNSGYTQVCQEIANTPSNKTIGGGIRRFYFEKNLQTT
jgi:GNAT superfamily N-acetyltransferase